MQEKLKNNKKFQILKQEFIKTVNFFENKEEQLKIKIDNILNSYDKHYNNLINYLLERTSIKKNVEKIDLDSYYNIFKKDKVDIYGVYSVNVKIDKKLLKEKVINNIVKRILKKLIIKEIEKQLSYIIIMYNYYYEIISEYHINKYYYYYYYKHNILSKYKEITEEELSKLLDKIFKNSQDFNDYFKWFSRRVKYKIIDFLKLTEVFIDFVNDFRKRKYIDKNWQEKEKTEIQLIWLKWNILNNIEKLNDKSVIEREKMLKKTYELITGKKINKDRISVSFYYLKKIKVRDNELDLTDFEKSIKKNISKLFFFEDFDFDFYTQNLYILTLYYKKKNKEEIKIENYLELIELESIKNSILEKHKKINYYIFNIKDFILLNDNILEKIITNYPSVNSNYNIFENYILEHLKKITATTENEIEQLIDKLEEKQEWWYDNNYNILSINKNIKRNLFNFLNQTINNLEDYKIKININLYI